MVPGFVVETDEEKSSDRIAEVVDGVVAARDRVFEGKSDSVKFAVRDAHAPDKIFYIGDVFLMRLRSEDNRGSPWSVARADPTIMEEDVDVGHDDFAFVGPVVWFSATDGWRTAGVDAKLKTKDWFSDAFRVETIPVFLDDGGYLGPYRRTDVVADHKVFLELATVDNWVPSTDISAIIDKIEGFFGNCFAVFFEEEHAFVDVVAIVQRNVAVLRFWPPEFGGNFDDVSGSGSRREGGAGGAA